MTGDSLTGWVVQLVQLAVVGLVGFFARHAFAKVETTLEQLGTKIDGLGSAVARGDGDRRVLEAEMRSVRERLERVERDIRELSEGVAR